MLFIRFFTISLLFLSTAHAINTREYFTNLTPDADGRIETLNNEGGMAPSATGAEKWLLNDLKLQDTANLRILEIGPAFGRLGIELYLQNFKGEYVAIDLSQEHLNHLQSALDRFPSAKNRINTKKGRFPQDSNQFKGESFDIIVITHVFHFFEPSEFHLALKEIHRLLTPNGKIYLTAKTPYSNRYHSFIPVYEQRVQNKEPNPGYIDNVGEWVDPATIEPERLKKLYGRHLYFFTKEDLINLFKENNFKIAKCAEIPLGYNSPIWQAPKEYADREDAVILAIK